MPLTGVTEVSHPGVHDGSGAEPEEDGEVANRGKVQRQSKVEYLMPRDQCGR
jgi:hypothetical protein